MLSVVPNVRVRLVELTFQSLVIRKEHTYKGGIGFWVGNLYVVHHTTSTSAVQSFGRKTFGKVPTWNSLMYVGVRIILK